jgi:glycosyltransferase involved in cell wall biosynthesis
VRIGIVHQYYLAPGDAGISRFNEMAHMWAAAGHDVTVIAGSINHHTGEIPERYRGRLLTRERDGAVDVWRCYVPSAYRRSYFGRRLGYIVFTLTASLAAIRSPRADVVIATSPPLVVVVPGWLKAKLSGWRTPWIFEVRDLWPESAISTGVVRRGSLQARLFYALEAWACRSASIVNVLTPGFRADLLARHLVTPSRLTFVPNGGDLATFRPGPRDNAVRREHRWGDRIVALYAGAHGRANALSQLLNAAEIVRTRPDILLVTVGDGPERASLEAEAARRGLDNLRFLGAKPKDAMPDYINAADIGLAVLQRNATFRTVYPNKIFDYMACARPVVVGVDGVARKLVCDDAQAGLFAEPENGPAIARVIIELADDVEKRTKMGRLGREWVEANASRESLAARYLDIMLNLADRPTSATSASDGRKDEA